MRRLPRRPGGERRGPDDDDLPRRRDRRHAAGRHRGRGRGVGRGAGHPRRRRPRRRELLDRRGPHLDRPQPRRRRLPRRRHRLAQPRAAGAPARRPLHRRPRLAQRHLRQPPADRVAPARRRRRDPDRQVQAQLPGALMASVPESARRTPDSASRPRKALTIGAVCKILQSEFDDVSISKIRYLEDQKLLNPRRTSGGYRLYSQSDVERLRTILRLQRDEFLPLRVIRQELAAGNDIGFSDNGDRKPASGAVRRAILVDTARTYMSLEEIVEETGAREELVSELENFGIVQPEKRGGRTVYDETDREIIRAANELSRVGVGARNLRVFRSSADREAQLLEALLGPSLRSRNPERRKEALQSLESLAATVSHLKHLLLVRDLRRLAGE